jgi:TetR/AcrR family transcriptional regulator, cholesterol catabolism regulator
MDDQSVFNNPKLITILDNTIALFYEIGIRNVNMDDICREQKISKKTLYHYFKSKEDLIESIFNYEEAKWDEKISQLQLEELNAIDVLFKVSLMVFDELGKLNPKMKFEMKKYYEPILNKFMVRKQDNVFNLIGKNIQKGINEGLYREDININLVASLYVTNLIDMHNKDYHFVENISFKQLLEAMFENHIRAISTPEGIMYFEKRKSEITLLNKENNNQ